MTRQDESLSQVDRYIFAVTEFPCMYNLNRNGVYYSFVESKFVIGRFT